MKYLSVKNWERWQSYRKDRGQPPWIKIHRCIMRNEDWVSLSDAQRGQLVAIWLLAADRDGQIPSDPQTLKKLCFMSATPDLKHLEAKGFIERDANVTPTWRQHDAPETETEESRDREEESRRDFCPEPQAASGPPTPSDDDFVLMSFECVGEPPVWHLTRGKLKEYHKLYGKVLDVHAEAKKARQWLLDNPMRTKRAKGMPRYLGNWMGRAVDSGRAARPTNGHTKAQPRAPVASPQSVESQLVDKLQRENPTAAKSEVAEMMLKITQGMGKE